MGLSDKYLINSVKLSIAYGQKLRLGPSLTVQGKIFQIYSEISIINLSCTS
jgi:hypothetical protein